MNHKDQIEARFAKAPPPLPRIHPNVAEIYRAKIQSFEDALARSDVAREAAVAMRGLLEKIVLTPVAKRGEVKEELHGELAATLALTSGQEPRPDLDDGDMRFSVVAGNATSFSHFLCQKACRNNFVSR